MKRLIFTLNLLPFLAVYPAGKPANASACAADVKIAQDEKARSAEIERVAAIPCANGDLRYQPTTIIAPEVLKLEAELFPVMHELNQEILGMEQELLTNIRALFDSKPIQEKYPDVQDSFLPPLWNIVSQYAATAPEITGETCSRLLSEERVERMRHLGGSLGNQVQANNHVIADFHKSNPSHNHCWPYSCAFLDLCLALGFNYSPENLQLTTMEKRDDRGIIIHRILRLRPWMRATLDVNLRTEEDSLLHIMNNIHHSAVLADADQKHVNAYVSWHGFHGILTNVASWYKIMEWLVSNPEKQQELRNSRQTQRESS